MKKKKLKIMYFVVAIVIIVAVAITVYLFMKKDKTTGTNTGDNFTCPSEKFINCMPQVGRTAKEKMAAERQNRYCDFVAKNCPNVIIAE